jgi:hypothetical protein
MNRMKHFFFSAASAFSILSIAIVLCISLFACNKDKKSPEMPIPPVIYNGLFSSSIYAVGNGSFDTTYFTSEFAGITSNALYHNTFKDLSNMVDAGNVSLNSVQFEKPSPLHFYEDNSHSNPFSPPHIWSISGSQTIPAFTFTNTNSYPIFKGYKNLPDSFHNSTGVVIPLTNFSNVDEIEVHFYTTLGRMTESKFFPANTDTIRISVSEFPPVGPFNFVTLYLNFYKNNKQVIDGNNYVFQTGYCLRKEGIKYN